MLDKKHVTITLTYWLTFSSFIVSIICLSVFLKGTNSSGDVGIAMWAIFLFTFTLVSVPLHMLLFVLTIILSFTNAKRSLVWVYVYILLTVVGHVTIAANYGAFNDTTVPPIEVSSTETLMRQAFSTGINADVIKVKQAIAEGLDVNSGLRQGNVPYLVQAASYADVPTLTLLLKAGADPNIKAKSEYMPRNQVSINNAKALDVIMFADNGDIRKSIEILLAAGAVSDNTLMKLGSCRKGDFALFAYANDLGAKTLDKADALVDANKKNCLHHAIQANKVSFLQKLLFDPEYENENAKALLNVGNKENQFPLDLALILKHYEAALIIIKAGGSANRNWSIQQTLDNDSTDPALIELKELLDKIILKA